MRVLVTGAAGFVGANLVARLLREGHEVHAVCRPDGDSWRLEGMEGIFTRSSELLEPGVAARLMQEVAPDWVFHLAAHGAYSWQTDVHQIIATNLGATVALVDAAEQQGVRAFIHAGSSSEYGFKDHAPDEDERPDPNSAYAVAKVAATMYCRYRALAGGFPAVTLRLYSVYGALEDHRRLIPTLISYGRRRSLPPLVSPDTARDFVYVEDACDAFVQAAERITAIGGGVYNVGSGQQLTLRELVECARSVMAISAQPNWGSYPQRIWDTNVWYASTKRTSLELGWSATTSMEDGLRRTIARTGDGAAPAGGDTQRLRAGMPAAVSARRDGGPLRPHPTTGKVDVNEAV